MNGTYTSFAAPTLSRTIACTEAYALSNAILHLLGINLWLLFAREVDCGLLEISFA